MIETRPILRGEIFRMVALVAGVMMRIGRDRRDHQRGRKKKSAFQLHWFLQNP
jgi:hypothetical protein